MSMTRSAVQRLNFTNDCFDDNYRKRFQVTTFYYPTFTTRLSSLFFAAFFLYFFCELADNATRP